MQTATTVTANCVLAAATALGAHNINATTPIGVTNNVTLTVN